MNLESAFERNQAKAIREQARLAPIFGISQTGPALNHS